MNRRNFLSFLATGTVVNAVAPSQVWPFKKIFLPAQPMQVGEFYRGNYEGFALFQDDYPRGHWQIGVGRLYGIPSELRFVAEKYTLVEPMDLECWSDPSLDSSLLLPVRIKPL